MWVQVYKATTKEFKCAFKSAGYMPKVATCTFGKCRKGAEGQERF